MEPVANDSQLTFAAFGNWSLVVGTRRLPTRVPTHDYKMKDIFIQTARQQIMLVLRLVIEI